MTSAIWIGNIRFKTTNISVKLHPATAEHRIQFHLFHNNDNVELRQQMVCAYDGKPVPADHQVRGFRVDENKYILISQKELDRTEPRSGRDIDIHEFVKRGAIDPVFLEKTYQLEQAEGDKAYPALAAALKETDSFGICTWTMRKRAHVGALWSDGKRLRLTDMRYADELVRVSSLGLKSFQVSEKELGIAEELVNKLTVRFRPEKYIDEHQRKLRALIEKKSRGVKIEIRKPVSLKATVPDDLLKVLEKSLQKVA